MAAFRQVPFTRRIVLEERTAIELDRRSAGLDCLLDTTSLAGPLCIVDHRKELAAVYPICQRGVEKVASLFMQDGLYIQPFEVKGVAQAVKRDI